MCVCDLFFFLVCCSGYIAVLDTFFFPDVFLWLRLPKAPCRVDILRPKSALGFKDTMYLYGI